ncbi:MAG TPA: thioredoxin family protein [Vicinamibacterales bacterium]|nr:thioredoxin family protein [Vicinamibacterales bacterium]
MAMIALSLLLSALVMPAQSPGQALFDRGMTWEAFFDAADARRELWQANRRRARESATRPEMVERLETAGSGLSLLVIAEAACSDSVNTVPFIAELAAGAGIELRIVRRDAGESLLAKYKTPDGRMATPTVVLMRGGQDVGAWVERPAALQDWMIASTGIRSSERLERKMAWYDWDRGDSTVADFLEVVERAR